MALRRFKVVVTTDSGGAFTGYAGPVSGLFLGAYLTLGTLSSGAVDITITEQETTAPLLTITNAAASARYLPRQPLHDNTGAAITGGYDAGPVEGQIKVVVAQGGAVTTGTLYLYVDDLSR